MNTHSTHTAQKQAAKQGKHTQGPWLIRKNKGSEIVGFSIEYSDSELRSVVAQMCDNQLCPEHGDLEANARLIASAPKLLNSLETLVFSVSHLLHGDGDNAQFVANDLKNALSAIAKAKGESK